MWLATARRRLGAVAARPPVGPARASLLRSRMLSSSRLPEDFPFKANLEEMAKEDKRFLPPGGIEVALLQSRLVGNCSEFELWRFNISELVEQRFTPDKEGTRAEELADTLAACPLGLLSQEQIDRVVAPRHSENFFTRVGTPATLNDEMTAKLFEIAGGKEEFREGALNAFVYIMDKVADLDKEDFLEDDVTTPGLGRLLTRTRLLRTSVFMATSLRLDASKIKVNIESIWVEEGSVDKPNKALGRFDWKDIKYHLLAGFLGPELNVFGADRILGSPPRRLVVAVSFEGKMEVSGECALNPERTTGYLEEDFKHYWVFESDLAVKQEEAEGGQGATASHHEPTYELQWRVRNINDAVAAQEGEKIPFEN